MASIIQMPKLGLTMVEGTITKWFKTEGDVVIEGERLFEVSTDKISNEIDSTSSGILRKILIKEGEISPVKGMIAIIGEPDEDISSILGVENQEIVVEALEKDIHKTSEEIKASPIAKKIAREKGIDLSLIIGTGPGGRIVEKDVLGFTEDSSSKIKASPMAVKIAKELNIDIVNIYKDSRIMKNDVYEYHKKHALETRITLKEERVPMSQMRKVIAARMHESWRISPAVTYDLKVNMTNIIALRDQLKSIHKFTYTDMVIKIVSKVLIEYPYVNSTIDKDHMILRDYVNIGVAVALDKGLVVPVLKFADKKGLRDISEEVKELVRKCKNNELEKEDLSGGTFTITNLGMFGIETFSPIINQPEVAILGINSIIEMPVVVNKEVVIRPMMKLSLTADHRAIDGAVAAQFLARVKEYIENPGMLLL